MAKLNYKTNLGTINYNKPIKNQTILKNIPLNGILRWIKVDSKVNHNNLQLEIGINLLVEIRINMFRVDSSFNKMFNFNKIKIKQVRNLNNIN